MGFFDIIFLNIYSEKKNELSIIYLYIVINNLILIVEWDFCERRVNNFGCM